MPEGPSIVIAKEVIHVFKGEEVLKATGDAAIEMELMEGQKITDLKSWGKHLLICFKGFTIRIHFLMFGSYTINEKKNRQPKLHLHFNEDDLYFYTCSVKMIDGPLDSVYDWSADIMNDLWNPAAARKKLKLMPATTIGDALLDQDIFSGLGNIIRNEVLFIARVHPESIIGNMPPRRLTEVIKQARLYSFDFLKWKKANVLKKHWLAYAKKKCPRCNIPLIKSYPGKTKRRVFCCENCQVKY